MVFDRTDRNAEARRDLGIGQFIHPVQDKNFARPGGKVLHRIAILSMKIFHLEGVLLFGRDARQVYLVQQCDGRRPASRSPRSVDNEISDDAPQIGFGRPFDVVAAQRHETLECVLHDVGGFFRVGDMAADPSRRAGTFPLEQVGQPGRSRR